MKQNLKIWADNATETHKLIEFLKDKYIVNHILTASPQPVVLWNGDMIVGLGSIYSIFGSIIHNTTFQPEYD